MTKKCNDCNTLNAGGKIPNHRHIFQNVLKYKEKGKRMRCAPFMPLLHTENAVSRLQMAKKHQETIFPGICVTSWLFYSLKNN